MTMMMTMLMMLMMTMMMLMRGRPICARTASTRLLLSRRGRTQRSVHAARPQGLPCVGTEARGCAKACRCVGWPPKGEAPTTERVQAQVTSAC